MEYLGAQQTHLEEEGEGGGHHTSRGRNWNTYLFSKNVLGEQHGILPLAFFSLGFPLVSSAVASVSLFTLTMMMNVMWYVENTEPRGSLAAHLLL